MKFWGASPFAVHEPPDTGFSDLFNFFALPIAVTARLNMHQHIPHSGNLLSNFVFHLVGDFMRALDGHLRVHLDVHVCVELVSHLSHETFFDAIHSLY